jgi:multicomponent Na+:H+ antiporter subunit G
VTAVLAVVTLVLAGAGLLFFLGAALGLLRFPDLYSRLHAVAKADTVGLFLIACAVALAIGTVGVAVRLLLIVILVMAASATSCTLIAHAARDASEGDDA